MIKPSILRNYRNLTGIKLEAFANKVLADMTGNANFPTPNPALAVLTAAITAYANCLQVPAGEVPVSAAEKEQKRLDLVTVLDDVALYVEYTARYDRVVLVSSGFKVSNPPGPSPEPVKPQNVRIRLGDMPGQLWLEWVRGEGQKICMYQYAVGDLTASTQWTTAQVGTRSSFLFTGLPSGQRVWLRVLIIGSENQEVVSDPVSMIVQ